MKYKNMRIKVLIPSNRKTDPPGTQLIAGYITELCGFPKEWSVQKAVDILNFFKKDITFESDTDTN